MFDFNSSSDMIEAHSVCSGSAPLTETRRNLAMADETLPDDQWEIYRATCAVSGKSYIGLTKSGYEVRWYHHVRDARIRRRTGVLHSAIQKHGAEAFVVDVIYVATSEREAIAVERGLIAQYGTMHPSGYNLTSGGETFKGFKNPRRKISQKHIEHLRRLAAAMKGKPRDRAAVEKTAAFHRGKPSGTFGKKFSPESIARMSAAQKLASLTRTPPYKDKKLPAETVERMRAAQREICADPARLAKRLAKRMATRDALKAAGLLKPSTLKGIKIPPEKVKRSVETRAKTWDDPVKRAAIIAKSNATRAANRAIKKSATVESAVTP